MVSIVLTWLPGWIISPSRASARTECGSYYWQLASPQQPVGTHAFSKLRGKEVAAWTSKHSAGVCQHCGGPTGGSAVKESACQCRRHGFHPWIRKIPWKRKWQPTPVSLPGKSHGQEPLRMLLHTQEVLDKYELISSSSSSSSSCSIPASSQAWKPCIYP